MTFKEGDLVEVLSGYAKGVTTRIVRALEDPFCGESYLVAGAWYQTPELRLVKGCGTTSSTLDRQESALERRARALREYYAEKIGER